MTCASWAACQSVASRSARVKRRASRAARVSALRMTEATVTQLALPITPRVTRPSGPAQSTVCTIRKTIPIQAQTGRPRVQTIVEMIPTPAMYQVA